MAKSRSKSKACCPDPFAERPLMSPVQSGGLAMVFKVLANDTRLRLLHAIVRAGELSVTALGEQLAMKPQAISNQLQRLSDLGVLASRREGNSILYSVKDVCLVGLLDQAWCLLESTANPSDLSRRACCETA